jgi:hypothetical protein
MPFALLFAKFKDYVYLGAIVALLIGFGLFVHHERAVGEAKVIAADQKAAVIAEQRDTALTAASTLADNISEGKYETIIQAPAVRIPAPVGLCRSAASSSVPSAAAGNEGGSNTAVNGSTDTGSLSALSDFATAIVKIGVDADAQIAELQSENATLRAEMEKAHGP